MSEMFVAASKTRLKSGLLANAHAQGREGNVQRDDDGRMQKVVTRNLARWQRMTTFSDIARKLSLISSIQGRKAANPIRNRGGRAAERPSGPFLHLLAMKVGKKFIPIFFDGQPTSSIVCRIKLFKISNQNVMRAP